MTYQLYKPARSRMLSLYLVIVIVTGTMIASVSSLVAVLAENTTATPIPIIINEIKSGGNNTAVTEYITLYNQSDQVVSLEGWLVEYAKASFPSASCGSANWEEASESLVTSAELSGTLAAHSVSQAYKIAINDSAAGAVHVVDNNGAVADLVGWGSDTTPAPCKESSQAPMLNPSKSLMRYLGCISSLPIDTDNNAADFMLSSTPSPGFTSDIQAPQCATDDDEPDDTASCEGVAVSELLPNPAGTDTGHEYIELHSTSNAVIDLSGCTLQTSANDKTYTLAAITLRPDQYYVIKDSQSGLTLPNSSGGTVWLLDAEQELQTVVYPGNMEDDSAWAHADGTWATSYTPTPASANIVTTSKPCPEGQIRNSETNRCVTIAANNDEGPVPCDPGQERNPETNRCRAIVASANSCPAGQVRNVETNRCRSIATASNTTTACKTGQERNPETNRCRNVATAAAIKACPTGQERNPDTNRCRKIAAAGSGKDGSGLASVTDVAANQVQKNKPYWLIAGAVLTLAIGYGIYEWRQEIKQFWNKRLTQVGLSRA